MSAKNHLKKLFYFISRFFHYKICSYKYNKQAAERIYIIKFREGHINKTNCYFQVPPKKFKTFKNLRRYYNRKMF